MTSENHWLITFSEILYLRFECKKCHAVFSVAPHNWKKLPYDCPNCDAQFMQMESIEEKVLKAFSHAVEDLRKIDNPRFDMRLELKAPD